MKVTGVFLVIVGTIFGFITASEFMRYGRLIADGNPFASVASNSFVYCGGIALTALLCGVGFLLAPSAAKSALPVPSKANPYEGLAWDGKRRVTPTRFPATPTMPPAPQPPLE
jgi:hypothetical protein